MFRKALLFLFGVSTAAGFGIAPSSSAEEAKVTITLVSFSAWNGEVSPSTSGTEQIGGASTLAAYWQNERAANPNTLILGTGNSFGTSPPISNLFDDEPAVRSMNLMRFDVDTQGNDNFDHGIAYLQRLLNIAHFPFISANLTNVDENLSGVRPYRIFETGGVKVAVIGVTDPRSPAAVFPGNFGSIEVSDPYLAAYRAREQAMAEGAQVFVLITEMGLSSTAPAAGPLIDLAKSLSGFDAVIGNGDSVNFSAVINGAQVVAGQSKGQSYGRTTLTFDPSAGKVTSGSVPFVQPQVAGVTPVAAIETLLAGYRGQLSAKLSQIIATSNSAVGLQDVCGQAQGRTCESLTGNIVADAMRSAYNGEIAIVNAGGIRAGLTCPAVDAVGDFCPSFSGPPVPITEGQVQAILPFANLASTVSIGGAELRAMLENGVSSVLDAAGRFPQVSGFCFWYDISRAPGSRVLSAVRQSVDGSCSGTAIDFGAAASYSLVTNDFVAAGGDGYAKPVAAVALRERLDVVVSRYLAGHKTLAPTTQGRINCIGGSCPTLLTGSVQQLPTGAGAATGPSTSIRPPSTGDAGLR